MREFNTTEYVIKYSENLLYESTAIVYNYRNLKEQRTLHLVVNYTKVSLL